MPVLQCDCTGSECGRVFVCGSQVVTNSSPLPGWFVCVFRRATRDGAAGTGSSIANYLEGGVAVARVCECVCCCALCQTCTAPVCGVGSWRVVEVITSSCLSGLTATTDYIVTPLVRSSLLNTRS